MNAPLPTVLVRGWRRLAFQFRRPGLDRELVEELEIHRAMQVAAGKDAGMSHEAALELARKRLGNLTLAKEECREEWGFMLLERLVQDLRYAVRMFARTPVFTAVAVLSLALGMGGNAAMFSLVNALLIRPLPYFAPGRLVRLTGTYPRAAVTFFQQRSRTMDITAVSVGSELNLTGSGAATRVIGSMVSANFLSVLGAPVAQGRAFEPGEDLPGRDGIVLISHALWRNRFASDPGIVGRVITINGINRQIVGVMPESFSYPSGQVQLWLPMRLDASNQLEYWAGEFAPFIARLRPGATPAAAHYEVRSILAEFRKTFPYPMSRDWNADVTAIPLQRDIIGDIRGKLLILLASVGMVLLIACANVANLLLSRATTRRKEIALRSALGAGRLRVIRQLLTESVSLALAGAAIGLLLGSAALSIFKSVLPASTPGLASAGMNWHITGITAALALLTGLAFGLAPAFSASQVDLTETIKTGSQRSTAGFWTRVRSVLVGVEVSLTLLLMVGAGLMLRSLEKLSETNPGFNAQNVFSVRISPNQFACAQRDPCIALYNRLVERTRNLPGVADAAVVNSVPLDGQLPALPVDVEDHPKTAEHPAPMLLAAAATPGYLSIMHIPLLAGRDLNAGDGPASEPVLVISASTAKHFWPGQSAIGKHIKPASSRQWRTVVGVAADVKHYTLSTALPSWMPGAIYMPYSQSVREDGQIPAAMTLLAHLTSEDATLRTRLRELAQEQDPNVPVGPVERVADQVSGSLANFRSTIRVFSAFAATAMLLAAIGIYGSMAYWVSQRSYEIGLRVAIGATRPGIIGLVLKQGLRVTAYGALAGLVAAFMLTRFLRGLLYGVATTDAATFAVMTALVLATAIAATAFPAWRASRIDPVRSLRSE